VSSSNLSLVIHSPLSERDEVKSPESRDEQARWLRLADIALHNDGADHNGKHRDKSLETRRKAVRQTKRLIKKLGAAA
jgi:hypothetical protein